MIKTMLGLSTILLILAAGPVCAHRPLFVQSEDTQSQSPHMIPNPDISWAVYGELAPGKTDYYEFEIPPEGLGFFAQLLVPTRPRYKEFRPTLALIGPGLPQADPALPVEIPAGSGALIWTWEDKEVFFEPFTQTRYYMARELRRPLPEGVWQLAVYHPQGRAGKYTLAVGEKEQWSWKDIFGFQAMWFRTRWWYSPGQTIVIILAGLGLIALTARLAVKLMSRFI